MGLPSAVVLALFVSCSDFGQTCTISTLAGGAPVTFASPYGPRGVAVNIARHEDSIVLRANEEFHLRARQQIVFSADLRLRHAADDLIAILQDHFRRWQAMSPSETEASQAGFKDRQKKAYQQIQKDTWLALRRVARDPVLRSALAKSYSAADFEELMAATLPKVLGRLGVYCEPSLHAYSLPSGEVFLTATMLDIRNIESIERPSLGRELESRLDQEKVPVRQRLVVRPIPGQYSFGEVAFDRAYFGVLAQRSDAIGRETNGIISGESHLMAQLQLPDHKGPNFNLKVSLDNLRTEIKQGADVWDLARTTIQALFFGFVHNAIERGRKKGEAPEQIVRRMREEIADRHEGCHLLDEWDPGQRIYREFYARVGDDLPSYRAALQFYSFHGEVDAAIGELRYGEPTMALDRLLLLTAPEYAPARKWPDSVDEHYRARLWVRAALVRMCEGEWGPRVGMQFVDGMAREDQVTIQLFRLAEPGNERVLRALVDAIAAKHDEAHLDPDEMMRRVSRFN
jgi:hypothetical protein